MANGRRAGGRRAAKRGGPRPRIDKDQSRAMRRWARDNGYTVSDRGQISQEIQEAYSARR